MQLQWDASKVSTNQIEPQKLKIPFYKFVNILYSTFEEKCAKHHLPQHRDECTIAAQSTTCGEERLAVMGSLLVIGNFTLNIFPFILVVIFC